MRHALVCSRCGAAMGTAELPELSKAESWSVGKMLGTLGLDGSAAVAFLDPAKMMEAAQPVCVPCSGGHS